MIKRLTLAALALVAVAAILLPAPAQAQLERVYHPLYLPAQHNWEFQRQFPAAKRLFNAFDYGHGVLYETLYTRPNAPVSLLEAVIYDRLTKRILVNPPRLPMPEASFMPRYARLVPLAHEMFEWAHVLHRQTYDILADDRITDKDAAMQELLEYYLASPLAFPTEPKGMEIMDEQFFSQEFRQRYPRFNGLIWAYHWLQMAVYEPLLLYDVPEERQAAVNATLARFWQMLEDPSRTLPSEMPMSPAIAPEFTRRYPEFAAIFDNLHMMHDVISDILVSEQVRDKRREIYRQADLFRDPQAMAVSREAWIEMALAHGLEAQGGPATGFLPPAPTVDAAPAHHQHDHHQHHQHHPPVTPQDAADGRPEHRHRDPAPAPEQHRHTPADTVHQHQRPEAPAHDHAGPVAHAPMMMDRAGMHGAMELFLRLLADPQVEARIHADPRMHELWEDPQVQAHLEMMRRMHPLEQTEEHRHDHGAQQRQPQPPAAERHEHRH